MNLLIRRQIGKRVLWGPEIHSYFWRLNAGIVGPLSENEISGSGLFVRGGKGAILKRKVEYGRDRKWFTTYALSSVALYH